MSRLQSSCIALWSLFRYFMRCMCGVHCTRRVLDSTKTKAVATLVRCPLRLSRVRSVQCWPVACGLWWLPCERSAVTKNTRACTEIHRGSPRAGCGSRREAVGARVLSALRMFTDPRTQSFVNSTCPHPRALLTIASERILIAARSSSASSSSASS